jgi:hypothetical protein
VRPYDLTRDVHDTLQYRFGRMFREDGYAKRQKGAESLLDTLRIARSRGLPGFLGRHVVATIKSLSMKQRDRVARHRG